MSSAALSPQIECAAALAACEQGSPAPLATWLRKHLFEHVLPFWERHAFDPQGGLLTCIGDDGSVESTEKWVWSQWRAVWVFARIYRTLDRDPRWLGHAKAIAEFCLRHAWLEDRQHWALLLDRDGQVMRGYESTYVDAFAVYGLTELYRASGEAAYLQRARATADSALLEVGRPYDTIPHFPYPIPSGTKPHGIPMLWSLKFAELFAVTGETRYAGAARALSAEIFRDFLPENQPFCREFVNAKDGDYSGPEGTAVVPGHAIEDMWFQIHVARLLGDQPDAIENRAIPAVMRHLQLGWDLDFGGGLLLAVDANGRNEVAWKFADKKLWWPHTEALYATLLAWKLAKNRNAFDWYRRLWAFCLEHYADWQHGEWRQKLNRDLTPLRGTIALPVKDPFHLPRSLILQIELLEHGSISI